MDYFENLSSGLWALFVTYLTAVDATLEDVERHLEMGKQFLSKGQFADALTHYHAAVDLDPENYQTLYRRATVYLALGKSRAAMPDLDRVLELKPDFTAARLQRGGVHLKQGYLDAAYMDYENVVAKEPGNADAKEKLALIEPTRRNSDAANSAFEAGDYQTAEFHFSQIVDACPWDIQLRERRAECYEAMGEIQKAISDIRASTKLSLDSTDAFYKLSVLYFETGNTEESLNQVRECLKLNPDHKGCFPHYKFVKKVVKAQDSLKELVQNENWEECISKADKIAKMVETSTSKLSSYGVINDLDTQLCRCHAKGGEPSDAIARCGRVLENEPRNIQVMCDLAEAFMANEQYDEAIRQYEAALEVDENHRRASEGVQRAKKMLKQSKSRDYYKILGVRRNANKHTIMKAYRKLAQKWHPDNFQEDDEKKKAEAKFIDIASAKEVLTDPEKRQKFDAGEDPLDPEQQQGSHQHPFFQGFNPFGSGSHFKFHFN